MTAIQRPARGRTPSRGARSGFTLIELIVVMGIIVFLLGLAVVVGTRVIGSGKESSTANTIRVLDTLLVDVIETEGRLPDPWVQDPRDRDLWLPIIDGRNMTGEERMINSGGLFLLQARRSGFASESIEGISPKLLVRYTPYTESAADDATVVPELVTPLDAWGNPIRFVHPRADGLLQSAVGDPGDPPSRSAASPVMVDDANLFGTAPGTGKSWTFSSIRRNAFVEQGSGTLTDSDGGQCAGQQPYFYSTGADGKAGGETSNSGTVLEDFNKDNVYTNKPAGVSG